jgi:hypothetical protein
VISGQLLDEPIVQECLDQGGVPGAVVSLGTAIERGAFGSIIRGDVPRWWAARYHRAWYEQISREVGPEDPASR